MKALLTTVAIALALPTAVRAQDWSGFYGGLSLGQGNGTTLVLPPPGTPYELDGETRGVFAGYNVQSGSLVYGVELAYQTANIALDCCDGQTFDALVDLKGRVGYASGPVLAYGVLGYSSNEFSVGADSTSGDGVSYGLGLDYLVSDRIFVGAEYLRRNMDNAAEGPILPLDTEISTFSLRLGMSF